jgi:hypothetical protein
MKKFLVVFSAVFMAIMASAQNKQGQFIKGDTAKMVFGIDTLIKKIAKDSASYRRITAEMDINTYRCYYLKDKDLKIVHADFISDTSKITVEWYFDKDYLIYSEQDWYNMILGGKLTMATKMYLNNENLIGYLSSSHGEYDPASEEFRELAEGLKDYARQLKATFPKQ